LGTTDLIYKNHSRLDKIKGKKYNLKVK